ncbi:hypothetical protein V5799_011374 [Amblyomma americanum]|uniref:Secreted protein n=1 Tax=Amblyomma americanum TaxID=6943 RepID=A0AAQ4EH99_AMBAM
MRSHVALCLLAAAFVGCVIVSADEDPSQLGPDECERLFPLPPWRMNYRVSCKYLCKGWPMRWGNEPDGIPCGVTAAISTGNVCKEGQCVKASSV